MIINSAEIVISAVKEEQYPEDNLPEVVLLGRSNVGKSSFINTLIGRKGLARTSSQPGKTQTMNFYKINNAFYFVDMPGYGYAKASKDERKKWGKMIETYLNKRENIVAVLLLVDSRHPPTEDDHLMHDWLVYYDLNPIVIATKADKLSKDRQKKAVANIVNELRLSNTGSIILFSATKKLGKEIAWEKLNVYLELFTNRENG